MTYSEKIDKINNDRILMLNMIKERISKNNFCVAGNLDTAILVFNADGQNTKEYKSILKAKQLIFELTNEISITTNADEVVALRKKINYYINKIKKEIARRNVNQDSFKQMYNEVTYLRNSMALYIRFLKRESIQNQILTFYKNSDNLSIEDSAKLKKLLNNELNYNKRLLKYLNNERKDDFKNVEISTSKIVENGIEEKVLITPPQEEQGANLLSVSSSLLARLEEKFDSHHAVNETDPWLKEDFLDERIRCYNIKYQFARLFKYDGTFFTNIANLFHNIPRYNWNKKIIKNAERDYNRFYHGQDLEFFIDYSKKRNSIKTALAVIFKSTSLSKREIECLYNHKKCKEWIIEFHSLNSCVTEENMSLIKVRY